jgi:hypothetical protein
MGDGASGPSGSTDAEGRTSPGARERAARGRTRGTFRVFYPEYGPVEAALGLVVLYLVVDVATPVLVESLAEPLPDLVPEPLTTLTAASLWVLSALVVFAAALDQWRVNPREFGSREDRDRFLDANRLEEWRYYANAGLVLAGAAVAVVSWDTFRAVLEPVLVTVVEVDAASLSGTPIADVVVFVAFFVGVSAVTRGIDRVVVGSLREFAYRRHRRHR